MFVDGKELLFICNRKRCEECIFPTCTYTRNVEFAYWNGETEFVEKDGSLWEVKTVGEVFANRHEREAESDQEYN